MDWCFYFRVTISCARIYLTAQACHGKMKRIKQWKRRWHTTKLIISPAKKMREDQDSFAWRDRPIFLDQAETIVQKLRTLTYEELKALWGCSDKLTTLNMERLQSMNLQQAQTPAILAYEGIQYQYMAPGVFHTEALEYIQSHLRIISGLYGCLRPFDAVCPYRLEMQAKLNVCKANTLYDYWGKRIADAIYKETDCVINLASKEYSLCVSRYVPPKANFITCIFAERNGTKRIEKGTLCKMARGEMVRYLAEHQIETPEGVKAFQGLNFTYSAPDSDASTYVFIKKEEP